MSQAFDQQIDVLRRTEGEYRAKCSEVASLRQQLADVTLELEKTKIELRKAEIRCDGLAKDSDKRQQALDVVLKELTAKRQIVEQVTSENQRLKRDLEASSRYSTDIQGSLKARAISASNLSREADAPAALYMNYCLSVGCDPSMEILRCLFGSNTISSVEIPATYQQLGRLVDVLRMKDKVNSEAWQTFDAIDIAVDHQESFHQVVELIQLLPSLTSVTLRGLGDPAAQAIASVLSTAESVLSLSLPQLCVTDSSFAALMEVIKNREILAITKNTPLLVVRDLDLSQCHLTDFASLHHIHGQCIERLNFQNCSILRDANLMEIIRECPALHKLSVSGCAALTVECLNAVNKASNLKELDITGCPLLHHLALEHVETLWTDLSGVIFLECPNLKAIPVPVTHFQCLSWNTPQLTELSLHSVSLHTRELSLLSECSNLTHLTFTNCRLQGLEVFLRRMRRLVQLGIHCCKGVLDSDILAVCSTIETLDLTECYCLTDKALIKISEICRRLKELSIKRCSNITDAAILQLEKIDTLEYLNVLGAKKVTVLALHRLVEALPSLKHVVHESFITPRVRVEREDEEELHRLRLDAEEKNILAQRESLSRTVTVTSPTKPSTSRPSTSPRLQTPKEPSQRLGAAATDLSAERNRADQANTNQTSDVADSPIPHPPAAN